MDAMDASTRLEQIRDDLVLAMKNGAVTTRQYELFQLATDLVSFAFDECPRPQGLDAFSLLVGHAAGSAIQKYADELEQED